MTLDWHPDRYLQFRDVRLRPALDLLAQVTDLPDGDIIDLGCGTGQVAAALADRFPGRKLVGVDLSPAMLEQAEQQGHYAALISADIASWQPDGPVSLIFSNAALHWIGDHETVLPRLIGCLAAGGVLAVQVPNQHAAPSHALATGLAAQLFPDRFGRDPSVHVLPPAVYAGLLAQFGNWALWETEYHQLLTPRDDAHPVRAFTQSTFLRPILRDLTSNEAASFLQAYDSALDAAYPPLQDGSILFPFRRLFFILRVGG